LDEMNLAEVVERLAALDEEVRSAGDVETVEKAIAEKTELLNRKAELDEIESRKTIALGITAGAKVKTIETRKENKMEFDVNMTPEEVRATPEYRSAFYKGLMGKPLTEVEKRSNEMATTDAAGVIPTAALGQIFEKVKVYAPLLERCTLLRIPGPVTFAVEGTNTAAAKHTQNAGISPSADVLTQVTLNAYEIMKILRISATLSRQSVAGFEGWLVDYLAKGIGREIGRLMIYGDGSSNPKGIDYMDTWADGSNAVDWAGASPTTTELIETVSYLKAGYHQDAIWIMNGKTFWNRIAAIQDNSKYKILTDDYKRILGYPVFLDDNAADDDMFFGSPSTLVANLSDEIKVARSMESGFLSNATDYRGTCIFDCTLAHKEGWIKSAPTLNVGA
jgi:HK97 family phage major capsid protein